MNEPNPPPAGEPALQFDRADFKGAAALNCAACKAPVAGEYYQANGQTVCPRCREQVANFGVGGSKAMRFFRASAAGFGAGVLGFLVYWGVAAATDSHWGIIAIAVGWLVGRAVSWGSDRRGGLGYQFLAVGITYLAICSSFIPLILQQPDDGEPLPFWFKLPTAMIISLIAPWFGGILSWIITGFGLLQAWQMNKKIRFELTGPFFTGPAAPSAAPSPS